MKAFYILLASIFLLSSCSSKENNQTVVELPIPRSYTVSKVMSDLSIDGKMTEESWDSASWTEFFIDIEGNPDKTPYFETRVKMLWDEAYLYIFADMKEEHVWGNITQRDAVIFHNNDFEVFIKPNEFQPYYAEFEVNALGTLWELFLARPYRRNGPVLDHWDVNGTKIGIDVQGTLNDPSDTDESWSVELAIPLKPLKDIDRGARFGAGSTWRINFSRVQWQHQINNGIYERKTDSDGNRLPENNWVWTAQSAVDMHRPEHWGYLHFVEDDGQSNLSKNLLDDEYQLLFYLYRKQLEWRQNHNAYTTDITQLGGPDYIVNGIPINASLSPTKLGFEITVSNTNQESLTLNQDGYIIKSP